MPSIPIDTNTSGFTTLVAAPGQYAFIRVVGLDITSNGVVTVSLYSGSNLIWKTFSTVTAGGGIVIPTTGLQQVDCNPNEALRLNLSAAVSVAGSLTYAILGVQ